MKRFAVILAVLMAAGGLAWWALGNGNEGSHEARTINLAVLAQKLYGAGPDGLIKLKQDDTITFHITADEPMEVFLHGYDVEARIEPGAPGTIQFTANVLGRFPLMIHELGDDQGSPEGKRHLEILLGLIDVLPPK